MILILFIFRFFFKSSSSIIEMNTSIFQIYLNQLNVTEILLCFNIFLFNIIMIILLNNYCLSDYSNSYKFRLK